MSEHIRSLNIRYRDQLIRELQVLAKQKQVSYPDEVIAMMGVIEREKARVQPKPPSWWRRFLPPYWRQIRYDDTVVPSDLYLLESTLIANLDTDGLALRIAGFRDMLSHILTEESYAEISRNFLDLSACKTQDLLPEAQALISRLYRRYAGVPAVEDIRAESAAKMLKCTLAIMTVTYLGLRYWSWPMGMTIGAAGAVGAAISTLERMYRLDPRHEPFKTWLALESGWFTLTLSPLIGLAFAMVLYFLIRANLLAGDLFPDMKCWSLLEPNSTPTHLATALTVTSSVSPTTPCIFEDNMAKLLAWGFLAGWAERMVPDVLNKLVPQTTASQKPPK